MSGTMKKSRPPASTFKQRLEIIKFVRRHRCLFDPSHRAYTTRVVTDPLWDQIGHTLLLPGQRAKQFWKNLRDSYRSQIKKNIASFQLHGQVLRKKWVLFDHMSFIKPCTKFYDLPPEHPAFHPVSELHIKQEPRELGNDDVLHDFISSHDSDNTPRDPDNSARHPDNSSHDLDNSASDLDSSAHNSDMSGLHSPDSPDTDSQGGEREESPVSAGRGNMREAPGEILARQGGGREDTEEGEGEEEAEERRERKVFEQGEWADSSREKMEEEDDLTPEDLSIPKIAVSDYAGTNGNHGNCNYGNGDTAGNYGSPHYIVTLPPVLAGGGGVRYPRLTRRRAPSCRPPPRQSAHPRPPALRLRASPCPILPLPPARAPGVPPGVPRALPTTAPSSLPGHPDADHAYGLQLGLHVAEMLRALPPKQRQLTKIRIEKMLFEVQFGEHRVAQN